LSNPKVHIVSFDVPFPADYGGAIDVFYKIRSLAAAGCDIYLHCFEYGRPHAAILEELCTQVWYYPRLTGVKGLSLRYPYITYSRRSEELLTRLKEIDAPILFEGIHSCYYSAHPKLSGRKKLLRAHNVEHEYYSQLAEKAGSVVSKIYFRTEAFLLSRYERSLKGIDTILCLSREDKTRFEQFAPDVQVAFVPPFHPFGSSDIPTGLGDYCLYHGNLRHPENQEAVMYLLEQVIPLAQDIKFVITGRSPAPKVRSAILQLTNCELIENPDGQRMNELIRHAQINLLPTFQRSGMKLKLLYALFSGRHVVANDAMLAGTGLTGICHVANTATEMVETLQALRSKPFDERMRQKRAKALDQYYNNDANARKIITYLQQISP
jgi:hypothetical protein